MLNDVHMNPLGGANLTLSNGSLNNLNSTLINPNDDYDQEDDDDEDEYIEEHEIIELNQHQSTNNEVCYADSNGKAANNRSFDAYTTATEVELAASMETEFY